MDDVIYRRKSSGDDGAKEETRTRVPCESTKKRVVRTTGARSKQRLSVVKRGKTIIHIIVYIYKKDRCRGIDGYRE